LLRPRCWRSSWRRDKTTSRWLRSPVSFWEARGATRGLRVCRSSPGSRSIGPLLFVLDQGPALRRDSHVSYRSFLRGRYHNPGRGPGGGFGCRLGLCPRSRCGSRVGCPLRRLGAPVLTSSTWWYRGALRLMEGFGPLPGRLLSFSSPVFSPFIFLGLRPSFPYWDWRDWLPRRPGWCCLSRACRPEIYPLLRLAGGRYGGSIPLTPFDGY